MNLIEHVDNAITKARNRESKLTPELLAIHDADSCMSSHTVRHLINNLCNFDGCKYLECGSWRGSCFCSAVFNNNIEATSIDYWPNTAEFRETRNIFHRNLHSILLKETNEMDKSLRIINKDCFKFDKKGLNGINVYLYDADHSRDSQFKGMVYYNDVLADFAIILIDDWNSTDVRIGTRQAFELLNRKILKEWELSGATENWSAQMDGFWNGVYIAVTQKII